MYHTIVTPGPPAVNDVAPESIETARASYKRCCQAPDFFVSFYRNLFARAPHMEPRFAKTNFTRQHKLLQHAIGLLLSFPTQPSAEPTILTRVADRHGSRDLDILPEWYPDFVEALVLTASEHDPEFSQDIEAAWRAAVAPGIAYMQARY